MNNSTKSQNNQPLFSIIIPCYNSSAYIDRCLQSCLNSTFDNFELIIINDGSTDNTLEKVKKYSEHDNRIKIYSKENGGYVSAVNYGLNHVKGIYFMLLGSDDEIIPDLLSNTYNNIKDSDYPDLIGFKTIIKNGTKTQKDKNSDFDTIAKEYNTNIKNFSEKYQNQSSIFFTRDTSKFFKTEILKDIRYFGKKGMDADGIFSMLLAHNAKSFYCIPVDGYIWYLREESLSGRNKDYLTQKDRINNWFLFGNEIVNMNKDQVTQQEKYYCSHYFYNIVKNTYFMYRSNFLSDYMIVSCQTFLKNIIEHFDYKKVSSEIIFFVNHPKLWKNYIILKVFFEKVLKKLKTKK